MNKLLLSLITILILLIFFYYYDFFYCKLYKCEYGLITFSKLGSYGDFGNQLFQIAAVLSLSKKYDLKPILPKWKYQRYFNLNNSSYFKDFKVRNKIYLYENKSSYENLKLDNTKNYDLEGYRQTDKYFKNIKNEIIEIFKPSEEYIKKIQNDFPIINNENTVSIHIRRGDYLNYLNKNLFYSQTEDYYYNSIKYIQDIVKSPLTIIIVSNDKNWCKKNLNIINALPNVHYSPFSLQLDDFTVLYLCKNHIIANSSYSWWSAYLSNGGITIAPKDWYNGNYKNKNTFDLYPKDWILFDVNGKKIDRYINKELVNSTNVYIVSCIYNINSKHSFTNYILWFRNFLLINSNKFIFTDIKTLDLLKKHVEIKFISDNLYYIDNCFIKVQEINDTYIYKKFADYLKYCEEIDNEKNKGHNYLLYSLWNNKPFFMKECIETLSSLNKNINYCFWVDIGILRTTNYNEVKLILENTVFMYPTMLPEKFLFSLVGYEKKSDNKRYKDDDKILDIFATTNNHLYIRIEGGFFGGNVKYLNQYCEMYENMLLLYKKYNLFIGKDQNIMYNLLLNNRDFFEIFDPKKIVDDNLKLNCLHDVWFRFLDFYTVKFDENL